MDEFTKTEVYKAKHSLADALGAIENLHSLLLTQDNDLNDLRRRVEDAERRASEQTEVASQNVQKAKRTDDLEGAITNLLGTIERLPVRMEDAGLVQTVVPPNIPLYGTHEWQAVMAARDRLAALVGRPRKETGAAK